MDDELVGILKNFAEVISAESGREETEELVALEQGILPFTEKCNWATGSNNMLKRALNYIRYTHGFPRTGASAHTYLAMLEALLEITIPVAVQDDESSVFLDDLAAGLERAREKWDNRGHP
jgi:hypothetical protein